MIETQIPQPVSVDPDDPGYALAVLKAARAWLDDSTHWCAGLYWKSDEGRGAGTRADVRQTCAEGALRFVAGCTSWSDALSVSDAAFALKRALPTDEGISEVNDGPDGYVRILAAFDTAIAKLEADAA